MPGFLFTCLCALLTAPEAPPMLQFERTCISSDAYEAASVLDVDNDGAVDILSGAFWYAGPDFTSKHRVCTLEPINTYYDDFSCYPMDVNGDGYMDVISGGYWGKVLRWRENPQGKTTLWTTHDVAEVGPIERACFYDIDGDGIVEIFPVTAPVHFFKLVCDSAGKPQGRFEQYTLPGKGGGHGFGCGDINGDDRPDVILARGWYEAPADPCQTSQWQWHKEFNLGRASVPILVFDVNQDGLNDLIVGEAHDYGLYWLEQHNKKEKRRWKKHIIETDRSQFHDLQLADIDHDGVLELITGKRYRAHNGHDPGSDDPLGLYYYEINRGDFQRITLDYGPPEKASGAGIYLWIADIDKNGWEDIVAPGKEGLYLFKNQGPKTTHNTPNSQKEE